MRRELLVCFGACVIAGCHIAVNLPVAAQPALQITRDSAERAIFRGDSIQVERLRLGALAPRTDTLPADTLRFDITNQSHASRIVGVSVRVEPGLWLLGNWQRGYAIQLAAGERRTVALPYSVRRLTPEGRLLLQIGRPTGASGQLSVASPFISCQFAIGVGNPAAVDVRAHFESVSTAHVTVLAYRGSRAADDMQHTAVVREDAIRRISDMLGVSFGDHVRVVLYPDSATKRNETGHMGMGWASGHTIVEIYNDRQRLDPFHELAHIVAGTLGDPPAALDEGFAVYVTELLGADALEYVGHPGRTVDQATCDVARAGRRLSLDSLLRLNDFGGPTTPGDVMYPQGGSLVKFLVESFGLPRFRASYRTLSRGDRGIAASFSRSFGATPAEVDAAWYRKLACEGLFELF